jgi:hypothetical protein
MAVSTAPSTSSVIMFGIRLAEVNELAMAGPSTVSNSNCLPNPVIRLTSVAIAIEPESRSSRAFALCFGCAAVSVADLGWAAISWVVGRLSAVARWAGAGGRCRCCGGYDCGRARGGGGGCGGGAKRSCGARTGWAGAGRAWFGGNGRAWPGGGGGTGY